MGTFEAPQPSGGESGDWESVVSSPSGVQGGAPAENRYLCFSSVTENDRILFVEMFVVN